MHDIEATRRRRARRRTHSGAAAVEFALISVVLFPLIFGVIEYGLWFNDSLNVRQGVREGARVGVVQNFDESGCTGSDAEKLACRTKKQIGAVTGEARVKIVTPEGWDKAKPLVVCAMVPSSTLGLVPLPNGGVIRSRTEMSIEVTDPAATPSVAYEDSAPAGADWGWCA